MRKTVFNSDNVAIAWIDEECTGPNKNCKHASRHGLMIHIIPAHADPRAEHVHLALPTYHYATEQEALDALQRAWDTAITVDNATDRDAAYARKVPVKILKSGDYR